MKNKSLFLIIIFQILCVSQIVIAGNILCLFGVATKSHHIWNRVIVNKLADRGHNLTVISVNIDQNPGTNVHYIHLENVYKYIYNGTQPKNNILDRSSDTVIEAIHSFYHFGLIGCEGIVSSVHGIQNLLSYSNDYKFDLILYDFTSGPCLLGFLHKFNYPPLISISAFNIPQFVPDLVGGSRNIKYVPHFALRYDSNMTFQQRLVNELAHAYDQFYRKLVFLPKINKLSQKMFGPDIPMGSELEELTQLVLVNSNPAIDFPGILPPNIIQVGGLQIQEPKPLPEDIESFMDKAPKGVILFALGTNFKSEMFGLERVKIFLETFRQMPEYGFLWKIDLSNLTVQYPSNVLVRTWLPQTSILNDKRTVLFLSHGGLLSVMESIYFGVPLVGIPIYVDQHRNFHKCLQAGLGELLPFQNITVNSAKGTIIKVLTDNSYKKNMKLKSLRFRDNSEEPLTKAIWWIEWTLRHGHSTFLSTPKINSYESFLLDNILPLILIISLIFIASIARCMALSLSLILSKKNTQSTDCNEIKKKI